MWAGVTEIENIIIPFPAGLLQVVELTKHGAMWSQDLGDSWDQYEHIELCQK